MRTVQALALSLVLAVPAAAQQCGAAFLEPFNDFSNAGAWGWSGVVQASFSSGGNPQWYLRSQVLSIDLPALRTQDPASPFAGDWRARGVSSTGIDLRVFDLHPSQCGRPVTLRLLSDAGTPANPLDDRAVLYVSPDPIPCKDASWHSYAVDVPSPSMTLPPGWSVELTGGLPPAQVWDAVVRSVTGVQWLLGDPGQAYPTTTWTLGADNPRLAFHGGPTTYCIAQPNSAGCSPAILWSGTPSASQPVPFLVRAFQITPQVLGLAFYGYAANQSPFLGGTLCVAPPIRRTSLQPSGGSTTCSGTFGADFNVLIQSGADPALVAGATVHAQYWSRDPGTATGSNLSNALRFTICP